VYKTKDVNDDGPPGVLASYQRSWLKIAGAFNRVGMKVWNRPPHATHPENWKRQWDCWSSSCRLFDPRSTPAGQL